MPLLRSTDPLRKNDVLASNLLFAFLAISIVEQLVVTGILSSRETVSPSPSGTEDFWVLAAVWVPLVLGWVVLAVVCYAVRRGQLWAKLLVLTLFFWRVFNATSLSNYLLAGVAFNQPLGGWQLLTLLKVVLNLAALVLMFKKPRPAPSGT